MPITHTNRNQDVYYLHVGSTKTGKPRFWFSTKDDGDLADSIPDGFEIYENPGAQVFLRKVTPQVVTPFEVALVENGLKRYAEGEDCRVDLQKADIVVYHSDRPDPSYLSEFGPFLRTSSYRFPSHYTKVMRFTLVDPKDRKFRVQRWCFRGSIDGWIDLWSSGGDGNLADLVKKYCPHIGQESFFELM
jgi:hypothetical protein